MPTTNQKKKREPWAITTDEIDDWDASKQGFDAQGGAEVDEFVKPVLSGRQRVVTGPKGWGKSWLLAIKAQRLRRTLDSQDHNLGEIRLYPGKLIARPVEQLRVRVHDKDLYATATWTEHEWALCWQVAVLSAAARILNNGQHSGDRQFKKLGGANFWSSTLGLQNQELTTEADHLFGVVSRHLQSLLTLDLKMDNKVRALEQWSAELNAYVQARTKTRKVVMFVDSPDELFRAHLQFSEPQGDEGTNDNRFVASQRHPKAWAYVQLGLLEALEGLAQMSPKVFVYASIRDECVSMARQRTDTKTERLLLRWSYTPDHLRKIFASNVALCDDDLLHSPELKDVEPMKALCGQAYFEHPRIKRGGAPLEEDFFSAILRHSTGAPRDVLRFGEALYRLDKNNRRGPEAIAAMKVVAREKVFGELQSLGVPFWRTEYDSGLALLTKNVIKGSNLRLAKEKAAESAQNSSAHLSLDQYLWRIGMLGRLRRTDGTTRERQQFRHFLVSEQRFELKDDDTLFLHPAVDAYLSVNSSDYATVEETLVGHEKGFPTRLNFEFHVGVRERDTAGERRLAVRVGGHPLETFGASETSQNYANFALLLCAVKALKRDVGDAVAPHVSLVDLKKVDAFLKPHDIKGFVADHCFLARNWTGLHKALYRAASQSTYFSRLFDHLPEERDGSKRLFGVLGESEYNRDNKQVETSGFRSENIFLSRALWEMLRSLTTS